MRAANTPAGPNSLDALCKRYGIDNTHRTKHGALVDSLLLATVYVELLGERQATLSLQSSASQARADARGATRGKLARQRPSPLPSRLGEVDETAHAKFVQSLGEKAIWTKYVGST